MKNNNSIPFSMNSGNIKKDIKAIKNWVDADLKYQVWSLNISKSQTPSKEIPYDKKRNEVVIPKK